MYKEENLKNMYKEEREISKPLKVNFTPYKILRIYIKKREKMDQTTWTS
jgi:hypothetical protein